MCNLKIGKPASSMHPIKASSRYKIASRDNTAETRLNVGNAQISFTAFQELDHRWQAGGVAAIDEVRDVCSRLLHGLEVELPKNQILDGCSACRFSPITRSAKHRDGHLQS
jgi:hypothetical protein